jgi:Cytochrome c7 and related cytochrome c
MPVARHRKKFLIGIFALLLFVAVAAGWSFLINSMLPADSRPQAITFAADPGSKEAFDAAVVEMSALSEDAAQKWDHVTRFREAGLWTYEGPKTCLGCHRDITVIDAEGVTEQQDLMENLTGSAHYRFFTTKHPNVYGFNGKLADNVPMGKLNRPCPKPGSFAMTAWAEIVVTAEGDTLSEGCGQCHIGGQYQAPLGEMMPLYQTLPAEENAIDCLICHSALYDMNAKQLVIDDGDRARWGQDRSLKAALSVGTPNTFACLRCHQHNFGGDLYIDPAGPEFMPSLTATGSSRPRVLHPGSKRGTPFSPSWDVHAAAGVSCLDCHTTEGHRIAKGTHTTTMMANDLPAVEVSCLDCHDDPPHDETSAAGAELNRHLDRIACQTCHIPSLHPDNVTRRDFGETEFFAEEGIYVYRDRVKENQPGQGIAYVWWNGDCTFLGNPIGDNPNQAGLYRFYNAKYRWPEFAEFDYEKWYEETMRPLAREGRPSKLYAMKRFNGRQHIDLQNMGPFGGMFVPYNLPAYYGQGNPDLAARAEMDKSMMKMMYGWMFKVYLLDKFISFMAVDSWNTAAYEDVQAGRLMEPRWLPNDAMLEISHGIRLEGALSCGDCHGPEGVLDWKELGYTAPEIETLSAPR